MRQVSRKRRLGLAGVAGALAVGVFAADAAGDAQVTFSGGALTVAVPSGASGDHKFFVEPFHETGGLDGWRVGSAGVGPLVGAPAITTSDSDCRGNFVFNDVVCAGQRSQAAITTRGGADLVVVRDVQGQVAGPGGPPAGGVCINGTPSLAEVATVNLGGGADRLTGTSPGCPAGTAPQFPFSFHFVADGGTGGDQILGTGGPDTLTGGSGADALEGRRGDDSLFGSADGDLLTGGPGRDRLEGEGERDVLDSRDGERDLEVDCGPNDNDVAIVDTGDVGGPTPPFLLGPVSVILSCEFITASPIDDGPPGAVLGRRLRIREDGLTRVRIACPRAALVRCRGRVSVRDPKHLTRALASASYAIRLGARKRVVLQLTSAERARLRRRGRAIVTTREQGRSRRGPRGVLRTFAIAGS